jgi:hypothetical protein
VLKSVVIAGLMLSAADASAQSVFVQGSAAAEVNRFSGEPANTVFDGTVRAIALGVGGHITAHLTVSAELDLGARSTQSTTTTVSVSGQSRAIHNSYTLQRRSISALLGYQTSLHHGLQVGYYAGLSFSTAQREITSDAEAVVLQTPAPTSSFTDRVTGAIVGIDAAFRVAPHIALVPALRAQGLPLSGDLGGHSIRPSIGVRIWF